VDWLRKKDAVSDDNDVNVPFTINEKVKKLFTPSQIDVLTTHNVFKEDDE
jgi:hypothetical protein